MFDPITATVIGTLVKGAVGYALEEQKKEREREARAQEIRNELVIMVAKSGLALFNTFLESRQNQRTIEANAQQAPKQIERT